MPESWLILETSARSAKVGLARDGAVVRAANLDETRRHARDLAPTVETLLRAEALKPADLTGIMVGRGPGSYTGLRIGLTSAKALAFAVGCKLIAVETFAAIAEQAPAEAQKLWVIADALQGQIYLQRFKRTHGVLLAVDELRIEPFAEWVKGIAGAWISGPGVNLYADRIPAECRSVAEAEREPRIESVFAVGLRLPPLTREAMFALEPLYLRGSSAEEKAKKG
jgi:tRNA threonylcarbamoyladenosine biosynthesis protein TsaB